ncbi:MAG: SGNH/GDSL hydrolase family protein [Chitinophagales bacterium]
MKRAIQYSLFLLLVAFFAVLCLEGLLRLVGIYNTYFEKNYNAYQSYYAKDSISGQIITRLPNSKIAIEQTEFTYFRNTNKLGLSEDREIDTSKTLGIVLGDSFTEGIGAPADSTWARLLEKQTDADCPIQTYNAGVAGSDVFFMRKLYEQKLEKLNPDLLFLCLNYSDISEYIYRGGAERFRDDGNTYYPSGPDWEVYYKHSHVVRFFVHFILNYDFTLRKKDKLKERLPEILSEIANQIIWLQNNTKNLVLIIHPYPYFKDKNVPFHEDFPELKKLLPKNIKTIDLYPDFEKHFAKNNSKQYYWPKDGHFNSRGYLLMSRFIYEHLKGMEFCKELDKSTN